MRVQAAGEALKLELINWVRLEARSVGCNQGLGHGGHSTSLVVS